MTVAALVATALIGVLVVFQLGLAAGAPWGAAAWGGRSPGVLPVGLRIASAVAGLVVYPIMAAVILAAGRLVGDGWLPIDPTVATWILAGFFGLGVLANAVSRSPIERVWAVASAVLAVCCVVIAIG